MVRRLYEGDIQRKNDGKKEESEVKRNNKNYHFDSSRLECNIR